ncbi:hypothetical protein BH18ACT8_BH18ACT8_10160 [soil metagenome]
MAKRHFRSAVAVTAATAAAFGVAGPTSATNPSTQASVNSVAQAEDSQGVRERRGYYDARQVSAGTIRPGGTALAESPGARVGALRASIGPSALVDIDPLTGTPANVSAMEGFLTGRSSAGAKQIALAYVRRNATDLGLRRADLRTLRLRTDYVDVLGSHHISWTQSARGIPVFGNGLKAHVTKAGELTSIQGSPIAGLAKLTSGVATSPKLSATAARSAAATDVGGSADFAAVQRSSRTAGAAVWTNGDRATLMWFVTPSGARLAWSTYTQAGDNLDYSHVVDAGSGQVLYRRDLVANDRGDAKVYDNYPGAPGPGGRAKVVNFIKKGWLQRKATYLAGANVAAWADLNDDNRRTDNEVTPVPGNRNRAQFNLQRFNGSNELCSSRYVCTWNANKRYSWRANKKADVTNGFYLANIFHDYLENSAAGFTARAGNFERADGDSLLLNALDGANTDNGFPDGNHVDNANMSTPPDGTSPTMQMYLFHFPKAPNSADPFLPTSSSFDAGIVYHEYVHGLSNRLVVDAQGNSTLNSIQAGSMGEAWSDYYATDYLVAKGYERANSSKDGQVLVGEYVSVGEPFVRTQAIDCPRNATTRLCTDVFGVEGGYTYGDFPTVIGRPEVHASGEIWAQTLWDMRERFGHRTALMLITRGMELSSADPSFLDMRNAILKADEVAYGGKHVGALWRVFARRGMGWYAGSIDGGDAQPAQDFHRPPAPSRGTGTLYGVVTNRLTGAPLVNARVAITGHPSYSDRTSASGVYVIPNVRPGRYKKVVLDTAGYEIVVKKVRVTNKPIGSREDFSARRDWAAASGGGSIAAFNGPDYSGFGCGPTEAIDLAQGTGWGSTTGDDAGTPTGTVVPKFIVVELPQPVDIGTRGRARSAFAVDPTAICGDPGSASTGDFTIEVSPTGNPGSYVEVASRSGEDNWLQQYRYTNVRSDTAVPNVRFVRFTIESPQVPDFATNCPNGPFAGCVFMDLAELEVFGRP